MNTKLRRCECCGQIIPPKRLFDGKPIKQRIYEYIAAHPEGVTRAQIIDAVYGDDPDGGPETWGVISVHVQYMRAELARHGLAISKAYKYGVYKIISVDDAAARHLWSEENVEKLLRLVRNRVTHSEIGRKFGVSGSAVSGKLDRIRKKEAKRELGRDQRHSERPRAGGRQDDRSDGGSENPGDGRAERHQQSPTGAADGRRRRPHVHGSP
jgi:hypothetical protein